MVEWFEINIKVSILRILEFIHVLLTFIFGEGNISMHLSFGMIFTTLQHFWIVIIIHSLVFISLPTSWIILYLHSSFAQFKLLFIHIFSTLQVFVKVFLAIHVTSFSYLFSQTRNRWLLSNIWYFCLQMLVLKSWSKNT